MRERGVKFAVVIVKRHVIDNPTQRQRGRCRGGWLPRGRPLTFGLNKDPEDETKEAAVHEGARRARNKPGEAQLQSDGRIGRSRMRGHTVVTHSILAGSLPAPTLRTSWQPRDLRSPP